METPAPIHFLGQRVAAEGEEYILAEDQFEELSTDDIFFIDTFWVKKNYHVPRFHTSKGVFTVVLTLDALKIALKRFGIIPLDSTNIVNLKNIDHVVETPFALTAYFKDGSSTNVAFKKRKLVAHLIRKG